MHVLPPANGKKLWRIKRLVSGSPSTDASSSLACFNSSMKISAAGKQFMARRPPLKRPKLKPGMPRDFVFVDLLPVKLDEDEKTNADLELQATLPENKLLETGFAPISENDVSASASDNSLYGSACSLPTVDNCFLDHSPSSSFLGASVSSATFGNYNYNYNYLASVEDFYGLDESLLGLGLVGVDFPESLQPQPVQQSPVEFAHNGQFPPLQALPQMPVQLVPHVPVQNVNVPQYYANPQSFPVAGQPEPQFQAAAPTTQFQPQHNRRKSAGGLQFKSYTGPNRVKKRKTHRRCVSEPTKKQVKPSLEDFLHMPKDQMDEMAPFAYTPPSEASEGETDRPMFKEEFDYLSFIQI